MRRSALLPRIAGLAIICLTVFTVFTALHAPLARAAARDHVDPAAEQSPVLTSGGLAPKLAVGDLVFIRVKARPFLEVAAATGSWTNHVGVVIDTAGAEPVIAESTFPLSGSTSLSRFVARSDQGRVAVKRLEHALTPDQIGRVRDAASRRFGVLYDTGFNLHSARQFCSRYVREVLEEATGISVGSVETFGQLLDRNPSADRSFWTLWYLGRIPWARETVTPASQLTSPELLTVFDGRLNTRR